MATDRLGLVLRIAVNELDLDFEHVAAPGLPEHADNERSYSARIAVDAIASLFGASFAQAVLPCACSSYRATRPPVIIPAWCRVYLTYFWQHRRAMRLRTPRRFTEWVQHRKLHDRDPRLPILADKVAVKAFVAAALGPDWVTPTLWNGEVLPALPPAPLPLVVKARQGCGHIAFVRTPADWQAARVKSARWSKVRYGRWLDEWAYAGVPAGLLIEPYLGREETLPIDYKLFVFGGRAAFVQVHLDRATAHRWIVMDRDWVRASPQTRDPDPVRPVTLDQLIAGAERLARDHEFLRVDCYEVAGQPLFGEITIYPGSGLLPLVPASLDRHMGELWRQARERIDNASAP